MDENNLEEKNKTIHQPEYIILDGNETDGHGASSGEERGEYVEALSRLGKKSFPFAARILIFLTAIGIAVASLIALAGAIVSTLLAGLILFQKAEVNMYMFKAWANAKKLAVFTLGLIIAIFSPVFGFGIIVLYLMLLGEHLDQSFFKRMFYQ